MTDPRPDYDPLRAQDVLVQRLRALHPTLIDLTTGRVERLLDALGRPQDRMAPVIHVAGTNGKGSTCAFLRAIGEAAGLDVHVLTSPHLVRFVERVRLGGTLITDEAFAAILDRVEAANASTGRKASANLVIRGSAVIFVTKSLGAIRPFLTSNCG